MPYEDSTEIERKICAVVVRLHIGTLVSYQLGSIFGQARLHNAIACEIEFLDFIEIR